MKDDSIAKYIKVDIELNHTGIDRQSWLISQQSRPYTRLHVQQDAQSSVSKTQKKKKKKKKSKTRPKEACEDAERVKTMPAATIHVKYGAERRPQ